MNERVPDSVPVWSRRVVDQLFYDLAELLRDESVRGSDCLGVIVSGKRF
ncbi:hypothetical protein [Aidingimonas lacisalsi]|nr:hypothetical protein [Aidingimonas lacisalsi]